MRKHATKKQQEQVEKHIAGKCVPEDCPVCEAEFERRMSQCDERYGPTSEQMAEWQRLKR